MNTFNNDDLSALVTQMAAIKINHYGWHVGLLVLICFIIAILKCTRSVAIAFMVVVYARNMLI